MPPNETARAPFNGLAISLPARDDLSLALCDLSDRGNAERFVARCGGDFVFVEGGGWRHFAGTHWSADGADGAALLAALRVAAAIGEEAEAMFEAAKRAGGEEAKAKPLQKRAMKLKEWSTISGSINRLHGMLAVARAKLSRKLDAFDADAFALNCANGTVRFVKRKGAVKASPEQERFEAVLHPHDPKDLITRVAPFAWRPGIKSEIWEAHLARCIPDAVELRFLARIFGYCALGLGREQVFFLFQGKGGDGKSVTVNAARRVLGGYAANADVKTFLADKNARSGASASPDLARLAGACRMVSTAEPERGAHLNEGLLKQITGGSPLVARHLNRDSFEFIPRFKLIVECNSRPQIGGADDGIWRRVVLMLWREQLAQEEMDPGIEDKIVAHGEAVLAWIVAGALAYLDRGLSPPDTIKLAHADYKKESNPFREWLEGFTAADSAAIETMLALYQSYKNWAEEQGHEERFILSQKSFGKLLSDQQIMTAPKDPKTRRARRRGLRLLNASEAEAKALGAGGDGFACLRSGAENAGAASPSPAAGAADADSWRYQGD